MELFSFFKQYEYPDVWLFSALTGCVPTLNPCRDEARVSVSEPQLPWTAPFLQCCLL